ncbi:MAG: hypothetical protein COA84_09975 [Robiginitomaculum sp.]|nr:MAG: hypothetical protein COA84_09975 [Robiginitomaculum sp.]
MAMYQARMTLTMGKGIKAEIDKGRVRRTDGDAHGAKADLHQRLGDSAFRNALGRCIGAGQGYGHSQND